MKWGRKRKEQGIRTITKPQDFSSRKAHKLIIKNNLTLFQIYEASEEWRNRHRLSDRIDIKVSDLSEAYIEIQGIVSNAILFLELLENERFDIKVPVQEISFSLPSGQHKEITGAAIHSYRRTQSIKFYRQMVSNLLRVARRLKNKFKLPFYVPRF